MTLKVKTSKPAKPNLSQTISRLKSTWKKLTGVDRAQAVFDIRKNFNISNRKIAPRIGYSESYLRHLNWCLQASAEDQELGRRGEISTRELANRGKAGKKRHLEPPPEVVEALRVESADEGADLICNWVLKVSLCGPDRVRIIKDVLDEKLAMEWCRSRVALPDHAALPVTELIQRYKPKRQLDRNRNSIDQNLTLLTEYAKWLDRWSFFAFKNPAVRDGALKQALRRLKGK
jgi:hypothetical protein